MREMSKEPQLHVPATSGAAISTAAAASPPWEAWPALALLAMRSHAEALPPDLLLLQASARGSSTALAAARSIPRILPPSLPATRS